MSPAKNAGGRLSRRKTTLLWSLACAIVIIALLYWEQAALIYVLSTLGVTVILVIVAFADLSGSKKSTTDLAAGNDAAAIGDGATQPGATYTSFGSGPKRRR